MSIQCRHWVCLLSEFSLHSFNRHVTGWEWTSVWIWSHMYAEFIPIRVIIVLLVWLDSFHIYWSNEHSVVQSFADEVALLFIRMWTCLSFWVCHCFSRSPLVGCCWVACMYVCAELICHNETVVLIICRHA